MQDALECKLPAGVHDLTLEADGFAPIHRFDVTVAAGESAQLEHVRWVRGASVHGWILDPDGVPVAGAVVALVPFAGSQSAPAEAVYRSRRGTAKATTDARGFFQAAGLAPGFYQVEAEAPSFARLRLADPVEMADDDALELELELAAPPTWTVYLSPALGPGLEPWDVSLRPLDEPAGQASPNVTGTASESGSWTWDAAQPGRYGFDVQTASGDSFHSEIVTISDQDAVVSVELSAVAVRGTVRRGDEPVTGALRMAAAEGREHTRFALDEEGRFEGVLPSVGRWWPEVEVGDEQAFVAVLDAVEVESTNSSAPVLLTLEVPDTWLVGEVVDGDGEPVAGATVTVRNGGHLDGRHGRAKPSGLLRSTADGTFSARGLAPGPLTIQARRGSATSIEHYATLVESQEGAPLRLVVLEQVVWAGLVESGGRPVAGARIALWSDRPLHGGGHSTGFSVAETVSRDDGVFELTLPADVGSAIVLSGAPGLATRLFRFSAAEREQVIISLAPGGGRLNIHGGGPRALARVSLEYRGIVVPSMVFFARLVPGFDPRSPVSTLASFASGDYTLCRHSPEGGPPACERAYLPPGGEVTFRVGVDGTQEKDSADGRGEADERSPDE